MHLEYETNMTKTILNVAHEDVIDGILGKGRPGRTYPNQIQGVLEREGPVESSRAS